MEKNQTEVCAKKTAVWYFYIQTEQARLIWLITSGNLSHAYIYGNHRKYPTVFGKLRKRLKTVSYAFLDFWKFSKNVRKSSVNFGSSYNRFLSNFASFENFLKIDIRETGPNTCVYDPWRGANTHFDRPCVNQSECRKLLGHIIITVTTLDMLQETISTRWASEQIQENKQYRFNSISCLANVPYRIKKS